MKQSKGRGGNKLARLVRVQILVRNLADDHEWIGDAIRSATAEFPLLVERYEDILKAPTESPWDPPNPSSLDPRELRRLTVSDRRTVMLYRLGGLADTGSLEPIVPEPATTGDAVRDDEQYRKWALRFPTTDHTRHSGNPELSADTFPPEIAEQFLAQLEKWVRERAGKGAASTESSLGRAEHQETATTPTRAASGDRVVPTGGGVSAAPSYLADVRDFVAQADACVAEVERWRQDDGHYVSPGLDRGWRTPFESMQRLYAEKIAPLCQCPLELPKDQEPFDWVREHHTDGDDRIMLNQACGNVVARLAHEPAEHDSVKIPAARVGDAKALLKRLLVWLARFEQRDPVGAASGGNSTQDAPTSEAAASARPEAAAEVDSHAIERAVEKMVERIADRVESRIGGPNTDWRDVQGRLLAKRDRGEPYSSSRKLAGELKCSESTIRKAIDGSDTLKGWRARSTGPTAATKAMDLSAMVKDNTRQTTEPAPDDVLPNDDVDATMARLINQARPDERAKLNALNEAERRALVAECQKQNLDIEPSPLESDKPGETPRRVMQQKRA